MAEVATDRLDGVLDAATVERLSSGFNRCFETLDAGEGIFAADVFFDVYPPFWRFQFQGADAFAAQLRAIAEGDGMTSRILRVVPTAGGFVMEQEQSVQGEHEEVARKLVLCEVRDGVIAEVVEYCNGGWDDELRARHAAEAPMLRP